MKNVIIITIDWASLKSIQKAERAKLRAENAGQHCVHTYVGKAQVCQAVIPIITNGD